MQLKEQLAEEPIHTYIHTYTLFFWPTLCSLPTVYVTPESQSIDKPHQHPIMQCQLLSNLSRIPIIAMWDAEGGML